MDPWTEVNWPPHGTKCWNTLKNQEKMKVFLQNFFIFRFLISGISFWRLNKKLIRCFALDGRPRCDVENTLHHLWVPAFWCSEWLRKEINYGSSIDHKHLQDAFKDTAANRKSQDVFHTLSVSSRWLRQMGGAFPSEHHWALWRSHLRPETCWRRWTTEQLRVYAPRVLYSFNL